MISVNMVDANVYQVVLEGSEESVYRVSMGQAFYRQLSGGLNTHEWVLVHAFRLILERDGRAELNPIFDLSELARAYPDFVKEMQRRLGN